MVLFNLTDKFEFFGIIYSLILLTGLYQMGSFIFKIKSVNVILSQISEIKYFKIFLATNLLLLIFYPLILYANKINFIPILSISLFFLGLFKIFNKFNKKISLHVIQIKLHKIKFKKKQIDKYLVIITLLGLFLLSLSPNTHGDSLGYHFVVAKKLLLTGKYITDITHFHSLLAGSGEIIIAIGLFFGAEQFGSLIQFSGLIGIFGIIKKLKKNDKYFYLLLLLTSPVILFLSSTVKPQLFHICSTAVIFCLYFFDNKKKLNLIENNWKIIISIIVLIVSVSAKFNFLISSFLLGLIIFYNSIKEKNFIYFISIFIITFFIFYFPIINWKVNNFGGNFYQYIYSPLPINIIGIEEFKRYLVGFGRQHNFIEIFFTNKLGEFTNSIGIAFLYLLVINFKKNIKALITIIISLIYILIHYFYGQLIGRSFLEPLFWILLICARYGALYKLKIFEFLCRLQALIVIGVLFIGICYLFPANLTIQLKDKVLSKNANGYSLFKWANTKLNSEDVVFSLHRSISLGTSKYISVDFIPFVDFTNKRSEIFVKKINMKNPNYLLTWSSTNQPRLYEFKDCVGKLLHYEKDIGIFEARNPFNRGGSYNGFIFEFKKEKLPGCIKK